MAKKLVSKRQAPKSIRAIKKRSPGGKTLGTATQSELHKLAEAILHQHEVDLPNWLESHGLPRDVTLAAQVVAVDLGEYLNPEDVDDIGIDRLQQLFRVWVAKKETERRVKAKVESANIAHRHQIDALDGATSLATFNLLLLSCS